MLIGSVFTGYLVSRVRTVIGTISVMLLISAALTPLLFRMNLTTILISTGIVAFTVPMANSSLNGFMAATVPTNLQGRIFAALGFLTSTVGSLSPMVVGTLIEHVDPRLSVAYCLLFTGIGAFVALLSSQIRLMPKPSSWEEYAHARQSDSGTN